MIPSLADQVAQRPQPFAFVKRGELPPWSSRPSILDVDVLDPFDQLVDQVAVVYRYEPGGWFVVTGHSGVKSCAYCGHPIDVLEPLVMDLGPLTPDWIMNDGPKYVRLVHNECWFASRETGRDTFRHRPT